MKEFPDRFKVIDAGSGAKGADGSIVEIVPNARKVNANGLVDEVDTIVVKIIKAAKDFAAPGQYWRISKDATYEEI